MTYLPPDYSDPRYDLTPDQLRTIKILQSQPAWRARVWRGGSASASRELRAPFIYKYMNFEQSSSLDMKKARDFLSAGELWISGLDRLNDVDEGLSEIQFVSDPVIRRKWAEGHARKLVKQFPKSERKARRAAIVRKVLESLAQDNGGMEAAHREEISKYGVHCFSVDPRNLVMWGLYAAGQTGVCFQLRRESCLGVLALTHAVRYQDEPVRLIWPADKERVADCLLTKSTGWAQEAEVRYVTRRMYQQSLPFDAHAVCGVIVGRRFDSSNDRVDALCKLLAERIALGLPRPRLYRATGARGVYECKVFRAPDMEERLDAALAAVLAGNP
jgi:hypothetical protein